MALFMIFELLVYCGVYQHRLNISPLLFILGFFLNLHYSAKFNSVPHPHIWPIRSRLLSDLTVAKQILRFSYPNSVCLLLCLLYCEYEFYQI